MITRTKHLEQLNSKLSPPQKKKKNQVALLWNMSKYLGWLWKYGPCYNANTLPSFQRLLWIAMWFEQTKALRLCFEPWCEALQPSRKNCQFPGKYSVQHPGAWWVMHSWWVGWLYVRRSNRELRSSNGSFKYGRIAKRWLHCTTAVSKWLAQEFRQ